MASLPEAEEYLFLNWQWFLTSIPLDHSCTVARRASIEFSNIANYINKWSEEQASAKRTLADIKQNLKTDKDLAMLKHSFFLDGNYSTHEQEEMKYWPSRANEGMRSFLVQFSLQV